MHQIRRVYARRLKRKHRGYGDTFFIDEVFVKINGKQNYLWRAVDQDGEVVDVYLQAKRDGAAAKRFFRRLLRNHSGEPRKIVTDKLRSYPVAYREVMPGAIHVTERYANNRAEQSHEATRVRERGMQVSVDFVHESLITQWWSHVTPIFLSWWQFDRFR